MTERLSKMGKMGAELLSKHLNDYFGMIIRTINSHGGDMIKIAGDALFVRKFLEYSIYSI